MGTLLLLLVSLHRKPRRSETTSAIAPDWATEPHMAPTATPFRLTLRKKHRPHTRVSLALGLSGYDFQDAVVGRAHLLPNMNLPSRRPLHPLPDAVGVKQGHRANRENSAGASSPDWSGSIPDETEHRERETPCAAIP